MKGKENEFVKIRKNRGYYADRTNFIREWWKFGSVVTVIVEPEMFGKTWMLSTLEAFFDLQYADKGELFQELAIWKDAEFKNLQGTYPVIRFSFADVNAKNYSSAVYQMNKELTKLYDNYKFLMNEIEMDDKEQKFFQSVGTKMDERTATLFIYQLSRYLSYYYRKKVIVLWDEYDVPMQKAAENGYRNEMAFFIKTLINVSFKTNPYLERAILTGTEEVGKDSVFSDLTNLGIVTADTKEYNDYFGFI